MPTPNLPFPELHIGSLRGVQDVHLHGCAGFNLLVGGNNIGKTTVLEAIALLSAPNDPTRWEEVARWRGGWPFSEGRYGPDRLAMIRSLFPASETGVGEVRLGGGELVTELVCRTTELMGVPPQQSIWMGNLYMEQGPRPWRTGEETGDGGLVAGVDLTISGLRPVQAGLFGVGEVSKAVYWENGTRPRRAPEGLRSIALQYVAPGAHRSEVLLRRMVSGLIRSGNKEHALCLLRRLDGRVEDLQIVTPEGVGAEDGAANARSLPTVHVRYQGCGHLPLYSMGDGLRRAVTFAGVVASLGQGGVLLIDEIETGMHPTVLSGVYRWLAESCAGLGVQVFATTHSLEAVDAVVEAGASENLALFRLQQGPCRRYSGPELMRVRSELGREVR